VYFVTGTAAPCTSIFKPVWLDVGIPDLGPQPAGTYDPATLFWQHERLHRATMQDYGRRLELYRHVATYVFVVGGLAILDWLTGGGWWVQWVAAIWGAILLLQLFSTFISPMLWGRDVEERMVRRELERRRGRISVTRPPGEGGGDSGSGTSD
jgi:hypothetical protein